MPLPTSADLSYTNRDYATIYADLLGDIPNKTPEWTNTNQTDLGVALLQLVSAGLDILSYSVDNNALETFLPTAIALPNVQAILRSIDYDMARNIAATVNLSFMLSAPAPSSIVIPAGTIVSTANGIQFVTGMQATIPFGAIQPQFATVIAYQGALHIDGPFTSNGATDQTYPLSFTNVADNFLQVSVNGVPWTEEKFIPNFPSLVTTIYRAIESISFVTTLEFDQYFGQAPANGQQITASYVSTDPTQGSVGAGLINTIVSPITLPPGYTMTVTNLEQSTTGTVRETIQEASVAGPRALRTLQRAVTVQDFLDFIEDFDGVDDASAVNHSGFVEIYVRLSPMLGSFPLFKVEPPVLLPPIPVNVGGALLALTTYFIAVTAVDSNGRETNYLPTNPGSGNPLNNPVSVTTGSGANTYQINIQLTQQFANQSGYNVYAGTSLTQMFLVNGITPLPPAAIVSGEYEVGSIPTSGPIAPIVNLAATQNPSTLDSYYNDLWQLLTPKRLLCTSFDMYNASTAPQNITLNILCQPNYRQIDVNNSVTLSLQNYFADWPLGQSVYLSALMNFVIQNNPGVLNINVITPTGDVGLSAGQYATLGTLMLNLTGGSQ